MSKPVVNFGKQKVGDLLKRRFDEQSTVSVWKSLFGKELSSLFKINLVSVICFLPVIIALYLFLNSVTAVNASLPHSSFIGVGYPTVMDISAKSFEASQALFWSNIVLLLPLGVFASLFLSISVQYITRNLLWRLGNVKFKELLKAFKFNWANGLIISFVTSLLTMVFAYLIYILREMIFFNGWGVGSIAILIGLIVFGVLFAIISMYAFSISITYKQNVFKVYKDAIVLTFRILLSNVVLLLITLLPIILSAILSLTQLGALIITVVVFIGFAWMIFTWTVYSQHVFDMATPHLNKAKAPYVDKTKKE